MHVSQGIVHVWLGEGAEADPSLVPRVPELDEEGWIYEQVQGLPDSPPLSITRPCRA